MTDVLDREFLESFPKHEKEKGEIYVSPGLFGKVEIGMDPDGRGTACVFVGWSTRRGHAGWHLPVTEKVVSGLCEVAGVQSLDKIVNRPFRLVRSDTRLYGFAALLDDEVVLRATDIWPDQP